MRNTFKILIILFFVIGCESDPIPSTPITIDNIKSSSIDYTSSTILFSITGNANKAGIMYGMEKELSNAQIQYAEKTNGEVSVSLNGLEQGTEYFYKIFAEDKKGNRMFSEIKNFITLSPSVKTGDATEITTKTATLSLSFEGTNQSEVGILYSTDELCKDNLQAVANTSPSGNKFSFEVKELNPGTTYYYKAYVKYKNGTTNYGEIKSFQTEAQYLRVSTTMIEAPSEGGTFQFKIEAKNIDWEISCDQDWCTTDPVSGKEDMEINVTVKENNSNTNRTSNITIKYLNQIITITLVQSENPNTEGLFILSTLANCVEPEGNQSCYFTISSNSSWTATSDQSWCTLQTTSGFGNKIIYYSVKENNSNECRIATITIQDDNGAKQHLVIQDMKNNPISDFCGVFIGCFQVWRYWFQIKSPDKWTIACNDDWCTIVQGTGNPNEECQIDMPYNYTTKDKIIKIDAYSGQYKSSKLIVQYKYKTSSQEVIPQIEMIKVTGGTFLLNDISSVSISDFSIGKYEVTQKQWFDIMGYNYSEYQGDDLPITDVTWIQVSEFIEKLNNLTGKKYRLPTEAEWEYASKGGNKSKGYIYSGSNIFKEVGWLTNPTQTTVFVGMKMPNELGIYDMTGNVGEYCSDWYSEPLVISNTNNPQGALTGTEKVIKGRGGATSIGRSSMPPSAQSNTIGFRLVLDK